MERCPTPADLLCASEGALDEPSANEAAQRHIASCATCRAQLAEIEALVDAGRRAYAQMKLSRQDDEARAVRLRRRLREEGQAIAHESGKRWWWAAAVVLPLYVVSLLLARMPESVVPAEEVIARATHEEQAQATDAVRRVRVEIKPASDAVQPRVWLVRDVTTAGWSRQDQVDGLARLVEALHGEGLDARPLSAAAFGAWRANAQGNRRDRVTVTGDLLVLQTVASMGRIRLAELMVNRTSYRVVGQTWVVDGIGRAELEALDQPIIPRSVASTNTEAGAAGQTPARLDRELLERAELRARAVLHKLEHDDVLEIAARGGRVQIVGAVASGARRVVEDGLRPIPRVLLELRIAAPPRDVERRGLRQWTASHFSAGIAGETFVPELRRLEMSVQRRMIALRRLAQRYPPTTEQALSAIARTDLQALVNRHVEALRQDMMGLDARLMLLIGVTERCALVTRAPANWRARVSRGKPYALAVGRQIEDVLTLDDVPTDGDWKRGLDRAFGDAWDAWCRPKPEARQSAATQ